MKWEKVKLKDCCLSIADGDHQAPPKADKGIPFVTISNIVENCFDFSNTMFVPESYYKSLDDKRRAQEGDILYSVVGSFGIPVLIKDNTKFVFQRHIAILRPNANKIDSKFLYYSMLSRDFYAKADSVAVGAAQRTISLNALRNLEINIPALSFQRRISSILSAYDDLIENNKKQIKLLEEATQRLYKEWFVDLRFPGHENVPVVDGVPEGWERCTITDLLKIGYGKDHKKLSDGDIPAYGSGGIFRKVNQKLHSGEAVLIPRKGTLNNIIHVDSDFWTIDTMFFGVSKIENCAKYAYFYLRYQDMYSYNIGAAVPSMTVNILDGMELLLPTKLMLEKFERTIEPLFSKQKLLAKQNETLTLSRDFLLPKLMNGEIEV